MENILTSKLVDRQLPDFVRSEHPKFVTFLKKYYEWLETTSGVNNQLRLLKEGNDIDTANTFYLDQLKRDLLPYFPEEFLVDKRLFLKLVSNFYKSNGTKNSIKFLFRALFNENIEIYYPKEDILKTSDGKWVLPLALRVNTNDVNIFNIEKTKITGTNSKATAIVEKVIRSVDRQLGITYTELYISNIQRLFETGELITATYNTGTSNVTVSATLVGALSEIKIDPANRGTGYRGRDKDYDGDPVTIIGGLNPDSENPIGAIANVGVTTQGSVSDIQLINGGFGFRSESDEFGSAYDNKVSILDFKSGFGTSTSAFTGKEAQGTITLIDESKVRLVNVSATKIETIYGNTIASLSNTVSSNVSSNTADANSFSITALIEEFQSFNVYPIAFVTLDSGGGGYKSAPSLKAYSMFNEDEEDLVVANGATPIIFSVVSGTNSVSVSGGAANLLSYFSSGDYAKLYKTTGLGTFEDIHEVIGVNANTVTLNTTFATAHTGINMALVRRNDVYKLGSLGLITIVSKGTGYANGETLIFSGGSGYGANAFVNVYANGAISTVTMNSHTSGDYLIGGEGYRRYELPTITINSANGAGANLVVAQVMGDGDSYLLGNNKIGSITSLYISSYGYDYVSSPIISLRNMDMTLSNVTDGELFTSNTRVYQGASNTNNSFIAYVDKYIQTTPSTGFIRLFNYKGTIDENATLKSEVLDIIEIEKTAEIDSGNVIIYGDGKARATAKFENGLIRYPGIYLNDDGHLSAQKYLQGKRKYHNFSYVINTQTDYNKFKKPLGDIVHPSGTKTFTNRIMNNSNDVDVTCENLTITINGFADTFNVVYNTNTAVTTNVTANLISSINIGDIVIFTGVYKLVTNTANVVATSNVIFGANCNFINDVNDGDILFLANTQNSLINVFTTVNYVSNSAYIFTENNIGITANASINVYFDEVKTVTNVSSNTITLDTKFISSNAKYVTINIQKVK
jgi:hypothetical protein